MVTGHLPSKLKARYYSGPGTTKISAARYPHLLKALAAIPNETVIDGEFVAFDEAGRPSFNKLQNYGLSQTPVFFYAFDLLVLAGRSIMKETGECQTRLSSLCCGEAYGGRIRSDAQNTEGQVRWVPAGNVILQNRFIDRLFGLVQ